jgi:glycosyltransferase involved in cell wall biosynthesis
MTIKVFALAPHENWICDRFVDEWNARSPMAERDPNAADVIWLLGDWTWRRVPRSLLENKRIITTVHHIVPPKFDEVARLDFAERDAFTHMYHVPCQATADQISCLTQKPIVVQPFWVNQDMWTRQRSFNRLAVKRAYALPHDAFLIGSFQRDTEGHDLVSPKLEKGPDILCDAIEKIASTRQDVEVILAGWRRQYVIGRLQRAGVRHRVFELPSHGVLRDLYCVLDLYIVGARFEGGPQAIVECAAMRVPCVSTPVGLATSILHPSSVGNDPAVLLPNTDHAFERVGPLLIANGGMHPFERLFTQVCDGS